MQYNAPLDKLPANPNASYVNGDPAQGLKGSIVSAESVEMDQREVVEVITRANARGYTDFDNVLCGVPSNSDQQQLRKAIEGFIKAHVSPQESWIIDTMITKTVHGSGADFPDLKAAMYWLSFYKITQNGWVHFTIPAGQWTYTQNVHIRHPDLLRVDISGAPLIGAPPTRDDFQWTGNITTDNTNQYAMLRSKIPTELRFTSGMKMEVTGATTLYNLLISGDRTQTALLAFNGSEHVTGVNGVAVHGSGNGGLGVGKDGSLWTATFLTVSGCAGAGIDIAGGLFLGSPVVTASNGAQGALIRAGGVISQSAPANTFSAKGNNGDGLFFQSGSAGSFMGGLFSYYHGYATPPASGLRADGAHVSTPNGYFALNNPGITATNGANVFAQGTGRSPTDSLPPNCSPYPNTVGNGNAMIEL